MLKIQLAVPNLKANALLTWLQEEEVLHIAEIKQKSKSKVHSASTVDKEMAYIQFALEFIDRLRKELNIQPKKSWRDAFAGKPVASLARLEQVVSGLSLEKTSKKLRNISDALARLKTREQEIVNLLADLHPWRNLAVSGAQLIGSDNVRYELLRMGVQEELAVKRKMMEIKTAVWQDVSRAVTKKKGTVYLEIVVHRTETEKLDEILNTTSAESVNLALPAEQTVFGYVESLHDELRTIKKRYKVLLGKGKRFLKIEQELKFAYDALLHRKERETVEQKSLLLPRTMIITGWLPKYTYKPLCELLEKDFPATSVYVDNNPKDKPPVTLRNSRSMEPFEAVTNIYGKPKYTELDPTTPLSLFFLVSFGLALTDAGYGLAMMLIMGLAEKYFRLKRETKKMVRLLFYAGASTAVFGALTGGWFGVTLENLPDNQIRSALLFLKVIDPISEPMTLLMVTFGVGVIQLLFAWIVSGYDHARKKEFIAMIFDDMAWFALVVLLFAWIASSKGLLLPGFTGSILLWLYGIIALVVLTGGRSHKNPVLRLGAGILSLYGLVSFVSDILSYSRLLALGLATGIIGLVVNMLGEMVGTSIPVVGWFLAVIVLIGGHAFNLGINALGAFIHSGRLQYVEFFPKFLEGGGIPYRPFGRVSKYVDNPKEFV